MCFLKGRPENLQDRVGEGSREHGDITFARPCVRGRAQKVPGVFGAHNPDNNRALATSHIHGLAQLSGPYE